MEGTINSILPHLESEPLEIIILLLDMGVRMADDMKFIN